MKRIIFSFFIILNSLQAQQNLFNIPSGDITNKKKFFYQHQLNVYDKKVESKAHFVYGLGKGWDVGVNIVGKGLYFSPEWRVLHNDNPLQGALYPIAMGTVQKQFRLTEKWNLNLGTQMGFNLSNIISNKELNHFSYALGIWHFSKGSRIVGGVYNTNQMFVGSGNTVGVMIGTELKLNKKFYLMGDWISGRNDAGVSVLGGMYNISKRIQLCGGWQIPNLNSVKPQGFVFEINILGWDL